ncbi:hypothetical protein ABBQ32_004308 [Trebouxia sp. C0010 RCD-2024]
MFRLQYSGEGATYTLADDVSLTKEKKWHLLFSKNWECLAPGSPTKWLVYLRKWKVGLSVAAMVSCGTMAGYRSDDLQDTRYFMELVCSVCAEPSPMQILALDNNVGKANQEFQTTYAALANHCQPHLDCLAYLSQLVLYQLNVSNLPLLALIYQNNEPAL